MELLSFLSRKKRGENFKYFCSNIAIGERNDSNPNPKNEKEPISYFFLQGSNVEFEVEGSTIKIEGIVKYVSAAGSVEEIAIFHNNKTVVFDE